MLLSRKLRRAFSQPITLIGIEHVQNPANATSITINKPSGTQEGDLIIALLFSTDITSNEFVAPDSNWNLFIESLNDGINRHCDVFYKTAAATESSSYTFTIPVSRLLSGVILTYRNAQIGFRGSIASKVGSTITVPEIKIPTNNCLLFSVFFTDNASTTFSTPSGMSDVISDSDSNQPSYKICNQEVNSGLTGNKISTPSGTSGYGVLFSLLPKNYLPRTITYIGSANTQSLSTGVTTLTIDKPANTLEGDLMIAFMTTRSSENWTGDTGWTEIGEQGSDPSVRLAYKIATASEGSSYTFTTGTSTTTPAGSILTFRNAAFDNIGTITDGTNPLTLDGINSSDNYGILLAFFARNAIITPTTPKYMENIIMNNDSTAPSYAIFKQLIGYGNTMKRKSNLGGTTNVGGVLLTIKLN